MQRSPSMPRHTLPPQLPDKVGAEIFRHPVQRAFLHLSTEASSRRFTWPQDCGCKQDSASRSGLQNTWSKQVTLAAQAAVVKSSRDFRRDPGTKAASPRDKEIDLQAWLSKGCAAQSYQEYGAHKHACAAAEHASQVCEALCVRASPYANALCLPTASSPILAGAALQGVASAGNKLSMAFTPQSPLCTFVFQV